MLLQYCGKTGKNAPVFWPGEFHGLYRTRGHKESDTTTKPSKGYYTARKRDKVQATMELNLQDLLLTLRNAETKKNTLREAI